ncbi:MAG: hypothetical protein ACTSRA_21955, partial [Promethearchaeota archaeon]
VKVIAGAILYSVFQSDKEIPRILTVPEIHKRLGIEQGNIYDYYHKYFKHDYKRVKKQAQIEKEKQQLASRKFIKHYFLGLKGLADLRLKIVDYFFNLLRKEGTDTSKILERFKRNILEKSGFVRELSLGENETLLKMLNHEDFHKYFLDLIKVVIYLISAAILHKKISANPNISIISKSLRNRNITLFLSKNGFPMVIADIYDHLKEKHFDFFPKRTHHKDFSGLSERQRYERALVIGAKIKIIIIRNIYNGKYFKDGKGQCPICHKEGLEINTDISRLEALEFHHKESSLKKDEFASRKLFLLFQNSLREPDFLEKLIKKMESEKVELICSNHHSIIHNKAYNNFKFLVNYAEIFSFDPQLIKLLIRVSVNSNPATKYLSMTEKMGVRRSIKSLIKKRYILEHLYNGKCPICQEINARRHLPAFDFHHLDDEKKSVDASYLLQSGGYSCSDIIKILERESGLFLCRNCHTLFKGISTDASLSREIYQSKIFFEKIAKDKVRLEQRAKHLKYSSFIQEPLKYNAPIFDRNIDYLFAIDDIVSTNQEATNNLIADYLSISRDAVKTAMRNQFFAPFIDIYYPYVKAEKRYSLTDYGKKALALLKYFRDYYSSI